ncbi:MAG: hypothetical protein ACE5HV_00075 [Acidobacteriota bacterium]
MQDYSYLNDPILDNLIGAERRLPNKAEWWQSGGFNGDGKAPRCVMLALDDEAGGGELSPTHKFFLESAGFTSYLAATRWNDAPERTFAEVKALQLRAIEARLRFHNIVVVLQSTKEAVR